MKRILTGAVVLGVGLVPTLAFCAQGEAPQAGSWLALLFYVINFAIFVFIVAHYGAPAGGRFFRDRASKIKETIHRSQTNLETAERAEAEAEAQLKGLEEEKMRLREEMRQETEQEVARIRQAGELAAQRIREDGALAARFTAENGRRSLQARLAAIAIHQARELISRDFRPEDQSRLLTEFLNSLRLRSESKA